MHVLLDYRPALRDRTGVGEWVHQLALNLLALKAAGDPAASGFELTLWSSSWRDRPAPAALRELDGANFVDRRLPVRPLTWAWNRVGWPPIEALCSRRFDIVHSTTPLLMPSRAATRACTVYDLDFLVHPGRAVAEMRRDFPKLVHSHTARADLVVTISEYSKRQIEQRLAVPAGRVVVCRPGVPSWITDAAVAGTVAGAGHILFVGTLEPRKNVPALVEAYRLVASRQAAMPGLVLAGLVTPSAAGWVKEAQASRSNGRVTVEGYVSHARRAELYAGARLVVLPSLDEGFGLPALEAMALGVPVVASNRGALPEVVGNAGVLIDPADVSELARAIEAVLTDPERAAAMRHAGLERSRQFNWRSSAQGLLETYAEAHRRGHARPAAGPGRRG